MSVRLKSWTLGLLLFATSLSAHDPQITIQSTTTSSQVEGELVTGLIELTIVNATDMTLQDVTLRATAPAAAVLGEGTVMIGTLDLDATVARTVQFQLRRSSRESGDPLMVEVTYTDALGQSRQTLTVVREMNGGGGL